MYLQCYIFLSSLDLYYVPTKESYVCRERRFRNRKALFTLKACANHLVMSDICTEFNRLVLEITQVVVRMPQGPEDDQKLMFSHLNLLNSHLLTLISPPKVKAKAI